MGRACFRAWAHPWALRSSLLCLGRGKSALPFPALNAGSALGVGGPTSEWLGVSASSWDGLEQWKQRLNMVGIAWHQHWGPHPSVTPCHWLALAMDIDKRPCVCSPYPKHL